MVPNYSLLKARRLTDDEKSSVEYKDLEYINENFESTGFKVFTEDQRMQYTELAVYMRPVKLYTEDFDYAALRKRNAVDDSYYITNIYYDDTDRCCFVYENDDGGNIFTSVPVKVLKEKYTQKVCRTYFIVYLEVMIDFDTIRGEEIANKSLLVDSDEDILGGYFALFHLNLSYYFEFLDLIETDSDEYLFFHTFESVMDEEPFHTF